MLRTISQVRDAVVALLYPTPCHACGDLVEAYADGVACAECWSKQPIFRANLCLRCGVQLREQSNQAPIEYCNRCNSFEFSLARAIGPYNDALRANVLYLKTHPYLSGRMCSLIKETWNVSLALQVAEVIVPVPLHRKRMRERGHNQAEIIARQLAKAGGRPLSLNSFQRVKATERHRAGMDSKDRARSVEKAFAVVRPVSIAAKKVLLVDDVFTTGSTLNECARTLKSAGAAEVLVFTLARVV